MRGIILRFWSNHDPKFLTEVTGAIMLSPTLRPSIFTLDRENELSKIFITSLGSKSGGRFQFKQTFEFRRPDSEISPA